MQVGETAGVQATDRSVTFSMLGRPVLRVDVTSWRHVYAVVELYGKAETVSITGEYVGSRQRQSPSRVSSGVKSKTVYIRAKLWGQGILLNIVKLS
jgi:hypothetical protein